MTTRSGPFVIHRFRVAAFELLIPVFFFLLFVPACCVPADEMTSTILVGSSRIDVHIESGSMQLSNQELMQWVRMAADSVATYYERFPVPAVALRIIPTDGRGVRGGQTFGAKEGGRISIHVGKETTVRGLNSDWMLTHEMVHLSFPSMADEHHWIEEGIATYVEPIARVRAKHMDAHEMWFELVRDLHQGLPQSGDEGLDNTHTWGRTYWGGALFCFLADIEIHKQTNNRKGLDDALRGILNAGGEIRYDWPIEKALTAGDAGYRSLCFDAALSENEKSALSGGPRCIVERTRSRARRRYRKLHRFGATRKDARSDHLRLFLCESTTSFSRICD